MFIVELLAIMFNLLFDSAVAGGVAYGIFKGGEYKGLKKGYEEASSQYEKKFHSQVIEFEKQKNGLKSNLKSYKKLCHDLAKFIEILEKITKEKPEFLPLYEQAKNDYSALKNLES